MKVARSECRRQSRALKDFATMNSSGPQSDSGSETHYFDPEQVDRSEQQFAVSLEEKSAPAQFVVETHEDPAPVSVTQEAIQSLEIDATTAEFSVSEGTSSSVSRCRNSCAGSRRMSVRS